MNLQELAEHTLNIEFPGRSLEEGLSEAENRAYALSVRIHALRDVVQQAEFNLSQVEQEYFEADRALQVLKNALAEKDPS